MLRLLYTRRICLFASAILGFESTIEPTTAPLPQEEQATNSPSGRYQPDVADDTMHMPADLFWNRHWPSLAAQGWRIETEAASGQQRFHSPPGASFGPTSFDSYQDIIAYLSNSDHSNNSVEQLALPKRQAHSGKYSDQQPSKLRTFPEGRRTSSNGPASKQQHQVKVRCSQQCCERLCSTRSLTLPMLVQHAASRSLTQRCCCRCAQTVAQLRHPCGARHLASSCATRAQSTTRPTAGTGAQGFCQ